jgi:GPH family glycoside/pentoside/hexuronide:cation symporter
MGSNSSSLSYWQKVIYSSGSLAVALSYQAFGTYIQFLYIDILGLRAAWIGIGWSVYGIWNAINDPLSGYWSDRTRTRWGRRIPWIAGLFLPLALTFYLLWVPPPGLYGQPGVPLFVYFIALVLTFDLLWTIVVMNWTALFPEMIPEEGDRATVSAWRQIFSLIGLLIGVALPPILAGEDWSGRGQMAILLSAVTGVFFGLSLLGSRERPEFRVEEPMPFKDALRTTLANRDFRYFLGANLSKEFIFSMLTATVPFYTKYALKLQKSLTLSGMTLDVGLQTSIFLGAAFIAAIPVMPLWSAYAKRIGGRHAWMMACVSFGVTSLFFLLANDFYAGVACTILLGFSLAGFLMLPDLLIADVTDDDERRTGLRREGMFFGMNGFVIRFAFSLQGMITGGVLTLSGYVRPSPGVLYPIQPMSAEWGIRGMISIVPALAALVCFVLLRKYSLHGDRLRSVREAVEALHVSKVSKLRSQNS